MTDTADSGFPSGSFRVSDADRERALTELKAAFQAGRITVEELDQRSGQVLSSRTGRELAVPLADLPLVTAAAERAAELERAGRLARRRVGTVVSAVGAFSFTSVSVRLATVTGPTLQQRELMQQVLAQRGISISVPPAVSVDWAAVTVTGVIALLCLLTFIYLRVTTLRHA